ncbi:4-hydroxybenzoate octaprenyltransferase [Maricaulis sp.]|uniref:4-hydroxybenzoate octaprenyltransferase n=1 Tax=Maricaulis sp. TaxID=1486257 RepID=UPI0025BA122D|nr:4-hydroxybenzoate octaprenyltransferase [Maricaulis sp.]
MQLNFDRRVADSLPTSWVDRAPLALRPYLRLARYDRPIGFWLLALPCWMGLMLARIGDGVVLSDLWLAFLFAVGAIAMRGAGCTYNDIVDRDLDARVARTADRPLAAGTVTLKQAWAFLAAQALVGLIVLVQLPLIAIGVGLASLLLVAAYPFMKRITWWPQAWLGLTFNWGVPVAYTAATGQIDPAMLALYLACVFWTLGYDTIYAHQDSEDDALVGVKSTARLFGESSQYWVAGFYGANAVLVALAIWLSRAEPWIVIPFTLYTAHLFNQVRRLDIEDGARCLDLFKSNRTSGLLLVATLLVGAALTGLPI